MPLNANLILGVKPPEVMSADERMMNAQKLQAGDIGNQTNQFKLQQAQSAAADEDAINKIAQEAQGDPQKLLQGLWSNGHYKEAISYAKALSDQKAQAATSDKAGVDASLGRAQGLSQIFTGAQGVPDDQMHDYAFNGMKTALQNKWVSPQTYQQIVSGMMNMSPQQIRDTATQMARQGMKPENQAVTPVQPQVTHAPGPWGGDEPTGQFTGDLNQRAKEIEALPEGPDKEGARRALQNQIAIQNSQQTPVNQPISLKQQQDARITANSAFNADGTPNVNYQTYQQSLHPAASSPMIKDIVDPLNKNRTISVDARKYNEADYINGDNSAVLGTSGKGAQNTSPENIESMAQMIANGQMPAPTGFASRSPAALAIMKRVGEINPNYSAIDFNTGKKAAADFATGKTGNAVRSFNVSISHLNTLAGLADALDNGDLTLVNQIGNAYAQQTGNPAPTNFNAAKKIVGDEIVKAIVGAGGGVADREEAARTISAANSPAQLKGVISTYKDLMNGQLAGLRQQYQVSTGRDDFDKFLSADSKSELSNKQPAPQSSSTASYKEYMDAWQQAKGHPDIQAKITAKARANGIVK